jgi:hypothetical protein
VATGTEGAHGSGNQHGIVGYVYLRGDQDCADNAVRLLRSDQPAGSRGGLIGVLRGRARLPVGDVKSNGGEVLSAQARTGPEGHYVRHSGSTGGAKIFGA